MYIDLEENLIEFIGIIYLRVKGLHETMQQIASQFK